MKPIFLFTFLLVFYSCQQKCQNCIEYPSYNVDFTYSLDKDEWKVGEGILNAEHDYYCSNNNMKLNLTIVSGEKEDPNTKFVTEKIINESKTRNDLGPLEFDRKVKFHNYEYNVYKGKSYERDNNKEIIHTNILYEYISQDISIGFMFIYEDKDGQAAKTDFDAIISNILSQGK